MNKDEYLYMFAEEETHWWYVGMRSIVLSLLPPSSIRPNPRVLDAGCGTGYSMEWFRKHYGARISGLDYYPDGLDFCRRRGEKDLVRGDGAALPFTNDIFDLVISFDVLTQLRDDAARRRALSEFMRVLKPGGRLMARVAAYEWLRSSHDTDIMTYHRYQRRELVDAVTRTGFQPLRQTYANTLLFPVAALWRLLKKAGLAPAGSDVRSATRGGAGINRALASILRAEAAVLRGNRLDFPFGLSLFVIAAKPVR
jgi:SAM-dependent methyltransferase